MFASLLDGTLSAGARIDQGSALRPEDGPARPGEKDRFFVVSAASGERFTRGGARQGFIEDPGSVTLKLPQDSAESPAVVIARIADLRVAPDVAAQVIVNTRDGTVGGGRRCDGGAGGGEPRRVDAHCGCVR